MFTAQEMKQEGLVRPSAGNITSELKFFTALHISTNDWDSVLSVDFRTTNTL